MKERKTLLDREVFDDVSQRMSKVRGLFHWIQRKRLSPDSSVSCSVDNGCFPKRSLGSHENRRTREAQQSAKWLSTTCV